MLGNLGLLLANQGRMDEAATHIEASLLIAREVGDRKWEGNARCNLGLLQHVRGRMSEARDQLAAALAVALDLGHVRLECVVRCNLGIVYEALADPASALTHYEAALQVARDMADRRSEGQVLNYLGLLHSRQGRFGPGREALDAGERLLREVADRLNLALLLCSRAELEHLSGHREPAAAASIEPRRWPPSSAPDRIRNWGRRSAGCARLSAQPHRSQERLHWLWIHGSSGVHLMYSRSLVGSGLTTSTV